MARQDHKKRLVKQDRKSANQSQRIFNDSDDLMDDADTEDAKTQIMAKAQRKCEQLTQQQERANREREREI